MVIIARKVFSGQALENSSYIYSYSEYVCKMPHILDVEFLANSRHFAKTIAEKNNSYLNKMLRCIQDITIRLKQKIYENMKMLKNVI